MALIRGPCSELYVGYTWVIRGLYVERWFRTVFIRGKVASDLYVGIRSPHLKKLKLIRGNQGPHLKKQKLIRGNHGVIISTESGLIRGRRLSARVGTYTWETAFCQTQAVKVKDVSPGVSHLQAVVKDVSLAVSYKQRWSQHESCSQSQAFMVRQSVTSSYGYKQSWP